MSEEHPEWGNKSALTLGGTPISLCLWVADVDAITELAKKEGMTVLIVEQNVRMALDVADTAYVLDHGVVVHHGPAAALAADESLIQSLAGASAEKWDLDNVGASSATPTH